MFIIALFTVFESFLFPRTIFDESRLNPATLYEEDFEVTIGTEIKFGMSELRTHTIYSHIHSYSLSVSSFGNELYRENVINLSFGFPIIGKLAAGLGVTMLNYWVKDTENHFGYSLRIGSIFHSTPVKASAWINNINVPKFSDIDYLPPNYSVRIGYAALRNLTFHFALRGIETNLPFFNFGLFYSPYRIAKLGVGVNTDPTLLEYGLEIYLGEFILNYSGNSHQKLGLSHSLSLGFHL